MAYTAFEQGDGQVTSNQIENTASTRFQEEVTRDLFSANVEARPETSAVSEQFGELELVDTTEESQEAVEKPDSLRAQVEESATLHRLKVEGGGREIDSTILLPDNYDADKEYPVVVGFHSFPGDGDGFGELIQAERLREQGIIVVLPSAESGMWESNTVDGISYFQNPFAEGHDDIAAIKETLNVVDEIYGIDMENVNFVAHAQGVPVAAELARQLDQENPGSAKRLFLTSGTMVNTDDPSIALPGTDVVHYEPGSDWVQDLGNWITWTDDAEDFMPAIAENKGCVASSESNVEGVETTSMSCADGSNIIKIYEKDGELSYPGQPERFDGIFGAGSNSKVDMTQMVIDMINNGRFSRNLKPGS